MTVPPKLFYEDELTNCNSYNDYSMTPPPPPTCGTINILLFSMKYDRSTLRDITIIIITSVLPKNNSRSEVHGLGVACGHINGFGLFPFSYQRKICGEGLQGRHALSMLGRTLITMSTSCRNIACTLTHN